MKPTTIIIVGLLIFLNYFFKIIYLGDISSVVGGISLLAIIVGIIQFFSKRDGKRFNNKEIY